MATRAMDERRAGRSRRCAGTRQGRNRDRRAARRRRARGSGSRRGRSLDGRSFPTSEELVEQFQASGQLKHLLLGLVAHGLDGGIVANDAQAFEQKRNVFTEGITRADRKSVV